jgi:hypothetical protein
MSLSEGTGASTTSPLLNLLRNWARRYTPLKPLSEGIAGRTISLLAANPELIEGRDLRLSVFRVLHRVALEDLMLVSRTKQVNEEPDPAP